MWQDVFRGVRISLSMRRGVLRRLLARRLESCSIPFPEQRSAAGLGDCADYFPGNQSAPLREPLLRAFLGLRRGAPAACEIAAAYPGLLCPVSGRLKALARRGGGAPASGPNGGATAEAPPPPWKPAPGSSGEPRRFDQRLYLRCSGAVGEAEMALCPRSRLPVDPPPRSAPPAQPPAPV